MKPNSFYLIKRFRFIIGVAPHDHQLKKTSYPQNDKTQNFHLESTLNLSLMDMGMFC